MMIHVWTRKPALAGMGLAATLLWAVVGCGGRVESTDDAVVTTEPGAASATTPASPGGTTETASTSKPSTPTETKTEGAPASATATKAEGFGTLKGRVVFDGEPPAPKALREQGKAEKDPEVCSAKPIPDQRFLVNKDTKGVQYALVYIPRPTAVSDEAKSEAMAANNEFDQKGCVFVPHVIGMMKGAKVTIRSSDPVGHNVNSKVENNGFNNAVPPSAGLPPFAVTTSSRPGNVVCDIHPWMSSWWMIVNSPYITVTDDKGNFELKHVPAGTQKVVVWQEAVHPKFVTASAGDPVDVKASGETSHDFHIKPEQLNIK